MAPRRRGRSPPHRAASGLNPVSSTASGPTAITDARPTNGVYWLEYRAASGYDCFVRNSGYLAGYRCAGSPRGVTRFPPTTAPCSSTAIPEATSRDFRNASLVPGESWTDPSGQFRIVVASADG